MKTADLLADAFGRIQEVVREAVDGLTRDQLALRIDPEANSISWLVWHLARVQDDHVAGAFGLPQVWTEQGWAKRFALPLADPDIGYGHSPAEVGQVELAADELLGYFDAVHAQTLGAVSAVTEDDLERVVDANWDPPVTLGVRLVSVISDDLQHAGQAAYLRGHVERER
ncbi:MAG TPA: DUF664 domain-containing protein [Pseudonocardia sp.]|jgi:hypothetical protein|nr:DUF664 domain-containing protein [Pseudonocardia sp.]